MKRSHRGIWLSAALALLILTHFPSSSSTSGVELGLSTRTWGMGLAGVADASDPVNAILNPALISRRDGFEVYAAGGGWSLPDHEKLGDGGPCVFVDRLQDGYFYSFGLRYGFSASSGAGADGRLGIGVRYDVQDFGRSEVASCVNTVMPWEEHPAWRASAISLGGGVTWRDFLSLAGGLSIRGHSDSNYDLPMYTSGIAFDLGFLFDATFHLPGEMRFAPSMGASVLNLSEDYRFEHYRLGLGARLDGPPASSVFSRLGSTSSLVSLGLYFDFIREGMPDSFEKGYALGCEVGLLEIAYGRIGGHGEVSEQGQLTYGFGVRVPLRIGWISLDYANLEHSNYYGGRERFGASVDLKI